jgi:hypothetical protein
MESFSLLLFEYFGRSRVEIMKEGHSWTVSMPKFEEELEQMMDSRLNPLFGT